MKTNSVLAILLVAAASPLAWAGAANARQQKASSRSSSSPAAHQKTRPTSHSNQNALAINSGTKLSAQLLTTLDAKKAKPGQRVVARVTRAVKQNGRTVIRKNARLIGHIVSARASGKGNAGSTVEVAFDRLVQGKSSTALSAVVTSILSVPRPLSPEPMEEPMNMPGPMGPSGPPMQPSGMPMGGGGGRMGGGGGLIGGAGGAVAGAGSTVGGTLNSGANAAGAAAGGGMNAAGNMAGNTMAGAHGILVSSSAAGSSAANSSAAASRPEPGSSAQRNSNPGLVNSVSGAVSGSGSANGSASAAGRNFGASGNASNQTGATSVFSRRKGNVQLQSGTQLQLQVVGSGEPRSSGAQPHPAAHHSSRPTHR